MMNTPIYAFSPAKLNLFLHITGKRPDGYHNLQTIFVALDFGDELSFFVNPNPQAPRLTLLGAEGLTNHLDDNLIIRAGQALEKAAQDRGLKTDLLNVLIKLSKKIPTGAGLGGGSSNAGTTLLVLNRLWQLNFDTDTLVEIAKGLGADVPFFIKADEHVAYIGEGIGERLTPIHIPKMAFLLLFPEVHNQTASFFNHPTLIKNTPICSHHTLIHRQSDYLYDLHSPFYNAFEMIACKNRNIQDALTYLRKLPTTAAPRLTGTGSTVFLPLQNIDDTTAQVWLANAPCLGVICQSLNKNP